MKGPEFAILDVETTNGDPVNGSIMEVAIVVHDGVKEHDRWSSLIDPREEIPSFVQMLTGIRQPMLKGAPNFAQVAHVVDAMTRNKLVIAHNVRFDMTILEQEFLRIGRTFDRHVLCTEQLSRSILKNVELHNLGSLCKHLKIPFHGRHRAMNDARATAELFTRLVHMSSASQLDRLIHPWHTRKVA